MMSEPMKPAAPINVTLTLADTEYSVAIPANSRYGSMQCRTAADVRVAVTTGIVATPSGDYFTMKSGSAYNFPEKAGAAGTLYFASATAGVVVELWPWTG